MIGTTPTLCVETASMLSVKLATLADLDELVRQRLGFSFEIEPIDDPSSVASLDAATRDWIAPRLANGSYRGYLGLLDSQVVATAAMLVYELPPLGSNACRRQGHVLNVWTPLGYRRRGYSRQILEFLIRDAQLAGIWRLFLSATPMGEPLYRDLGFHQQEERALVKRL